MYVCNDEAENLKPCSSFITSSDLGIDSDVRSGSEREKSKFWCVMAIVSSRCWAVTSYSNCAMSRLFSAIVTSEKLL